MRDRRVRGDHQIERGYDRGGVQERAVSVELGAKVEYPLAPVESLELLDPVAFLEAHQANVGVFGERREMVERDRPPAVGGIVGSALPGDSDVELRISQRPRPAQGPLRPGGKIGGGFRHQWRRTTQ